MLKCRIANDVMCELLQMVEDSYREFMKGWLLK